MSRLGCAHPTRRRFNGQDIAIATTERCCAFRWPYGSTNPEPAEGASTVFECKGAIR